MSSVLAPRRPVRTYVDRQSRECYLDTGRPVDERLGTHVVLWIVDDPEAWAAAIEAEADAEYARWPKSARVLAESRRNQRYAGAAGVRADDPGRSWRSHEHSAEAAAAHVAGLRSSHPNPGVRYEIAEITDAGAAARTTSGENRTTPASTPASPDRSRWLPTTASHLLSSPKAAANAASTSAAARGPMC